ncbi:MAG: ABC transporter permease [Lachnospiraceae bacterium]|nr:ABC transporter permease [Lachnospiraceae bacterium]
MVKYLLKRLLHGLISVVIVVAIVMILIYSLMDRNLIFAKDSVYSKKNNNDQTVYKYQQWETYGYLDYVPFSDYMKSLANAGELATDDMTDEEVRSSVVSNFNSTGDLNELTQTYVDQFTSYYESQGYKVTSLSPIVMTTLSGQTKVMDGGSRQLFASKDKSLVSRLITYFTSIISVDNINYADEVSGERGLTFTLYDPVYGGDKLSPAIMGNGTKYKYLVYFTSDFPYIHQNLVKIQLGVSYSVNQGIDVWDTMTQSQGSYVSSTVTWPTGKTESTSYDLHSATYSSGSLASAVETENTLITERYTDDYTNLSSIKGSMSKMGYSFVIGFISVVLAYLFGVPLGIIMARYKDGIVDKIGSLYIIFIIAVPSLAYIFLFKGIGRSMGLPTTFVMDSTSKLMYVLPVVSLALPSIASLMKWLRRYMIDQMNSDYVKFARSGGLTEGEIFSKHIFKNAAIPIIHGIPGSVLGCLVGAIITERVYVVPGAGNLLTTAINAYDNGVIVGVTLFYAMLSVISLILGDILMAMVDPRISFTDSGR